MSSKNRFNPILFERILRLARLYVKASERNKPIAKEWFSVAKDDIQISKLLIDNQHYAASIYHLQQAFEKLSKCYFILSGRMEPEQARDHKFILNRLKKEIKDEYINNFLELSNSINETSINLSAGEHSLEVIEKNEDELRQITSLEIEKIINLMNDIEIKLLNSHFIKALEKKLKRRDFLRGIRHVIFKITHFRTSYSQVEEATDTNQVKLYIMGSVISIKLLFLSLITYVHSNSPRYPSVKDSTLTYSKYNNSLGIVEKTNLLINNFNIITKYIENEYLLEKETK